VRAIDRRERGLALGLGVRERVDVVEADRAAAFLPACRALDGRERNEGLERVAPAARARSLHDRRPADRRAPARARRTARGCGGGPTALAGVEPELGGREAAAARHRERDDHRVVTVGGLAVPDEALVGDLARDVEAT
jgi:hypothetical protein